MKKCFYLALCVVLVFGCQNGQSSSEDAAGPTKEEVVSGGRTRQPAVAGRFYEGSAGPLEKSVLGFLKVAKKQERDGRLIAAVVPHAGYYFSGRCAASVYGLINKGEYKRIIVLGSSHSVGFRGIVVPDQDVVAYETPLGSVVIDRKVCSELAGKEGFGRLPGADRREHSIEVQLPFLQKTAGEFKFVPLLCGAVQDVDIDKLADLMFPYIDKDTLLLASSDFTHYGSNFRYVPFSEDKKKNLYGMLNKATGLISALDREGFGNYLKKTGDTICGQVPIRLLMAVVKKAELKARGQVLDCYLSGDVTGDYNSSVSYGAVAFFVDDGEKVKKK